MKLASAFEELRVPSEIIIWILNTFDIINLEFNIIL